MPRHPAIGTLAIGLSAAGALVLGLRFSLPAAHATGQGGVKNLFDRNYYYWEGFPEQGRSAYVTLRYAF